MALLLAVLGGAAAQAQGTGRPAASADTTAPDAGAALSGAEMAALSDTLRAAFERDPGALPQRQGPDGGAAFARLTAPVHADRWAASTLPLGARLQELGALTSAFGRVLGTYSRGLEETDRYVDEMPGLLGAAVHLQAVALQAMGEAARGLAADTAWSRRLAPALEDTRRFALTVTQFAVASVVVTREADTTTRLQLADRLVGDAPGIAAGLDAPRVRTLIAFVDGMRARATDAVLAERLDRFNALLRAGAAGR